MPVALLARASPIGSVLNSGIGVTSVADGYVWGRPLTGNHTTSDFDREKLQERLAKLSCGVAIIKVGAATEVELKEKKARVEDALSATRAAVEEGIVPGGGTVLVRASEAIAEFSLDGDELTGANIVRRALEEPIRTIASNSGHSGDVIIAEAKVSQDDWGFDADAGVWGPMIEGGIVDPVRVTRAAVENSSSVVARVLTTEYMATCAGLLGDA